VTHDPPRVKLAYVDFVSTRIVSTIVERTIRIARDQRLSKLASGFSSISNDVGATTEAEIAHNNQRARIVSIISFYTT
jgi:hypothetical protein